MAKKNPPDERVVYFALKNVFKGPLAEVRQPKAIHKLITKHKKHVEVDGLIREHDFEVVCNVARILLTEQIFESTLKAKLRFPEIFDVSPAQSAEREASEAEAAKNEANAIRDAIKGHQNASLKPEHKNEEEEEAESESDETHQDTAQCMLNAMHPIPSLFPVYLPFPSQRSLLLEVQTMLEQACFEFGQQKLPDLLQRNRWDCPESVELNLWITEFLKRKEIFHKKRDVGKPLETLFRSVADIRHAAVHRIRVSAKGIEQFMFDAEIFANLLGNPTILSMLANLRRHAQQAIEELERNKHILRAKFEETVKSIAIQRVQLDNLERAAINEMLREDNDYQQLAALNLLQAKSAKESAFTSAIVSEQEPNSEMEGTESATDEMDRDFKCSQRPG